MTQKEIIVFLFNHVPLSEWVNFGVDHHITMNDVVQKYLSASERNNLYLECRWRFISHAKHSGLYGRQIDHSNLIPDCYGECFHGIPPEVSKYAYRELKLPDNFNADDYYRGQKCI